MEKCNRAIRYAVSAEGCRIIPGDSKRVECVRGHVIFRKIQNRRCGGCELFVAKKVGEDRSMTAQRESRCSIVSIGVVVYCM